MRPSAHAVLLTCSLLLAGCGGDTDDTASDVPGAAPPPPLVLVSDSLRVRGALRTEDGWPVAGVRVEALDGFERLDSAESGKDGEFDLWVSDRKVVTIAARGAAQKRGEPVPCEDVVPMWQGRQTVVVPASDVTVLMTRVPDDLILAVDLVPPAGESLGEIRGWLDTIPENGASHLAVVVGNRVEFRCLTGNALHLVRLSFPDQPYFSDRFQGTARPEPYRVVLRRGKWVRGRVVRAPSSARTSKFSVCAIRPEDHEGYTAETDGPFRFLVPSETTSMRLCVTPHYGTRRDTNLFVDRDVDAHGSVGEVVFDDP